MDDRAVELRRIIAVADAHGESRARAVALARLREIVPMQQLRLLVTGRDQGYAGTTLQQKARALHLDGWVRNLADGRVEALVAGPEPLVAELIEWARGDGPPGLGAGFLSADMEPATGPAPEPGFRVDDAHPRGKAAH